MKKPIISLLLAIACAFGVLSACNVSNGSAPMVNTTVATAEEVAEPVDYAGQAVLDIYMFTSNDFSTIDEVLTMRDNLFERLAQSTKEELARITNGESNSRSGMLFLGIISETKTMVLQSRNLLKSRRYFIEQEGKVIRQKRIYE